MKIFNAIFLALFSVCVQAAPPAEDFGRCGDYYCTIGTGGLYFEEYAAGTSMPIKVSPNTKHSMTVIPTGTCYIDTADMLLHDLAYDGQSANFTLGKRVSGGTSGASGIILLDNDGGATGTLTIANIDGTFQDNETITGAGGGSATANIPSGVSVYDNFFQWSPGDVSVTTQKIHNGPSQFVRIVATTDVCVLTIQSGAK